MMQQDAIGQELDMLNSKVDQLQQEQQARLQQPYSAPGSTANPNPPAPPVTVVLQNGQSFQSADYAVMNGTFWDFSQHPARRVPVNQINLAASEQASQASGAEFPELNP
jgi:hypothetical protein